MAVAAHADIDLGDARRPVALGEVDEQRHLDAPTLDERQRLDHRSAARVLARQRLVQAGELREEQRQQRAGDELGGAAAAAEVVGTLVVGLDERHGVVDEQRLEQAHHPVRRERRDVAVAPHDEVAAAGGERRPQHVALAAARRRSTAWISSMCTTVAPAERATAAVSSVELSSMTISSSTRSQHNESLIRRTTLPTVAASLRHGMQTLMTRSPLAATASAHVQLSTGKVRTCSLIVRRLVGWGTVLLYGVVNASPDSLNEDSIVDGPEAAVARARRLLADGADALDVGGQGSTDAATVVPWEAEWRPARSRDPGGRRARRRRERRHVASGGRPPCARGRGDGDQRRRRHADRGDVGGRRRSSGADRGAVPVGPEPARDGDGRPRPDRRR